jgi:nitrate/nitrite-specific signal transduction histidine kinase
MITLVPLSRTQRLFPRFARSLSKVTTFNDFLTQHAKFAYPTTTGTPTEPSTKSVHTANITLKDVRLLEPQWKASHAVRDPDLVHKLCSCLRTVLGSKLLDDQQQQRLLAHFSPEVEFERSLWQQNGDESDVSFVVLH